MFVLGLRTAAVARLKKSMLPVYAALPVRVRGSMICTECIGLRGIGRSDTVQSDCEPVWSYLDARLQGEGEKGELWQSSRSNNCGVPWVSNEIKLKLLIHGSPFSEPPLLEFRG